MATLQDVFENVIAPRGPLDRGTGPKVVVTSDGLQATELLVAKRQSRSPTMEGSGVPKK